LVDIQPPVKLSVQVMAHAKRGHRVGELVERLGITGDQVTWDRKENRWDTGRRAWLNHDPAADWHMVIQDDALPCRDLIATLEQAIPHIGERAIVCPYIGTRRPAKLKVSRVVEQAQEINASWVKMQTLNWGVAILAPTSTIIEMIAWCDGQTYPNYDRRVGQYYWRERHWHTYCTWPSLVEHWDYPEGSLIGHGGDRVAHGFIGADRSGLDVDWAGPVAEMELFGRAARPRRVGNLRTWYHIREHHNKRVVRSGTQADLRLQEDPEWTTSRHGIIGNHGINEEVGSP
jgi:hypothetical protein